MMSILTIILFFIYTSGLGFILISLLKIKEEEGLERQVMRIGLGLCLFIFLAVLLNMLNIPLHWWFFLILSGVYPVYWLVKNYKTISSIKPNFSKIKVTTFLLLLLFSFMLFMHVKGSFAYEHLEDDDPWTHAREMKYVAQEKTLDVPYFRPINYLDPYPPAYALIMGILHQTSPEAQWTLKFFNSLLIALSVLFFFYMVLRLTKSEKIALASSFVLVMLPSYLSHFIWSHTLIPLLFMLLIYSYLKVDDIKYGWALVAIVTAALFLTHTRQVLKLGIMAGIFLGVVWFYEKRFPKKILYGTLAGAVLSLAWWAFKFKSMLEMLTHGSVGSTAEAGAAVASTSGLLNKIILRLPSMFSPTGGTGTRSYSFSDFFLAKDVNMINSPIGWGIMVSILVLVALVLIFSRYKKLKEKENYWLAAVLGWFAFTFLAVNSATFHLPVGIEAFRTWMVLAIPVSILCGYAMVLAANSVKQFKYPALIGLVVLIFLTSGIHNYKHNTNPNWPPGGKWTSNDELQGYIWMKNNLPLNSNVFTYSSQNKVVFGLNMDSCVWCEDYREFHPTVLDKDVPTVYSWLKTHKYGYIAFGGMEVKYLGNEYGQEAAAEKINVVVKEMSEQPGKFMVVHQTSGFILFEII